MLIGGAQELTTLDFPGRLAAVVFLWAAISVAGSCHNPQFVDEEQVRRTAKGSIPEEVFFKFLEKEKAGWKGCASAEASRPCSRIFWNSPEK